MACPVSQRYIDKVFFGACELHATDFPLVTDTAQNDKSGILVFGQQIAVLDVVFSLDSVITAVGMVEHLSIMAIAIIASVLVMLLAAKPISDFVDANPTIKMLALSFLLLIGVMLIAEGFDIHVPKGYIYFAVAFSVTVELLNIRLRKKRESAAIQLNKNLP